MLLREFPDITWLKKQVATRFENQIGWHGLKLPRAGWPSVILNTQAKNTRRENIAGPLSIFTNLRGNSIVSVKGKQAVVSVNTFFVSNPQQEYTLAISSEVETFNIHVGEHLGNQALHEATHNNLFLLDNPFESTNTLELHNRLHWRDQGFNEILKELKSADALREEELLGALIYRLLDEGVKTKRSAQQLSVTKHSTRKEIERRLFTSVEFIYSNFEKELSLDVLSRISCLSKFHFLRLFKEYFRESPHQFITRLRLEKSIDYLKSSSLSVSAIAREVGIHDSSSFSRLFRKHFGVYPTQFAA